MSRKVIHNALIVNENSQFHGYVSINGELIDSIGRGQAPQEILSQSDSVEDAGGGYLLPGAIDCHVHFREPGLIRKGDIFSESRSAVSGGVTSYMEMPNTIPPTVTLEALREKIERAGEVSAANYAFYIGATRDNLETLLECDYTRVPGVKLFLGSSTGNMLIEDQEAIKRIFSRVKALIAVHAEEDSVIRQNINAATERYGEDVPIEMHPKIRSSEACVSATRHAVQLAKEYGTRLHILHLSTAEELEFFENLPLEEKRITAETCVSYLWWCSDDYPVLGARIKCNPAIKSSKDRQALRQGLNSGLIDIVSTDHAPHLPQEKQGGALKAASGIPTVQFSLPMMLELADKGIFNVETVDEKMAHSPARLFKIDRRGFIRRGYFADLTIVKPASPYLVSDESSIGRCRWTPLDGTTLHNQVVSTYVNGQRVFHRGRIDDSAIGKALRFNIETKD